MCLMTGNAGLKASDKAGYKVRLTSPVSTVMCFYIGEFSRYHLQVLDLNYTTVARFNPRPDKAKKLWQFILKKLYG